METLFIIIIIIVKMIELNAVKHPASMLRRNLKCFLLLLNWMRIINGDLITIWTC